MNWQPLLFLLKLIRLSGGELFEFLIEQDYLTENEAMSFIQQVVEAVDYIHNHHIVHLDIKVSWILLFFSSLMPPSPWWETHWLCKDIFFSGICMHTIWILKSINLSPFATNLNFMGTFIWKSFLFCLPKQLGQLCVANLLMKKSSNKDESINRRFTTATDVGHLPCMKSRWLNLCTECTSLGIEEQSWIG